MKTQQSTVVVQVATCLASYSRSVALEIAPANPLITPQEQSQGSFLTEALLTQPFETLRIGVVLECRSYV